MAGEVACAESGQNGNPWQVTQSREYSTSVTRKFG
jgi:hypothetical protein